MTAYRHFNLGYLNGVKMPNGTILIDIDDENNKVDKKENINVVLYTRVSSSENKDNLNSQLDRLRSYANAKGYVIKHEIQEIGSGLNDKRKKLENILIQDDWNIIIVEHKDRLARFGVNYIDVLLNKLDKKIEVINECDNQKEDIMQDFVSIITSFCSKIYGLRRSKRKTEKIISELNNE
jgi:predicted site-specific integrase-resolvase